ncbi:hypothetical protein [Halegenticoccus soli]|uniref:hypothetical protein n=1 Tax=Halegenticoccus soli TaxID=1985678 RepID=UPI0018EB6CAB|nr:hypothetical protein [Halegenticoccus soli]
MRRAVRAGLDRREVAVALRKLEVVGQHRRDDPAPVRCRHRVALVVPSVVLGHTVA